MNSMALVSQIYRQYSKISGSCLNINKCALMPINGIVSAIDLPKDLKVVEYVKICGVYFGLNAFNLTETSLRKKLEETVAKYSNRRLTTFSRTTIINVVVLAKLWYVVNTFPLSSVFIKWDNKCIFSFFVEDHTSLDYSTKI
jgi:hypothetical protein